MVTGVVWPCCPVTQESHLFFFFFFNVPCKISHKDMCSPCGRDKTPCWCPTQLPWPLDCCSPL